MNIYFSGLGGVGIGPLVDIALDAGYSVQGSDLSDSPSTRHLRERGVAIEVGKQDGAFLRASHQDRPLDLFVYTAALPSDHSELVLAKSLGIQTVNRYEFLSKVIDKHKLTLIAISGTHGKTTTTGMVIWVAKQLGIPISYSIGTTINFGPAGKFDPTSKYFVLECDEYERHLLHFRPYLSILPTIDYDHPDSYPTVQSYHDTFAQFIRQSQFAVTWNQEIEDLDVGLSGESVLHLVDRDASQEKINSLLTLPGRHSRENAYLVYTALTDHLDADATKVLSALNSFPGTGRRFEKLADNLYSDYGHHPDEITVTLQMARELSDHVVLVYQPHQNRRQHALKDQDTDQFELADKIYWAPTYLSREDPDQPILTPQDLSQNITNKDAVIPAELDDGLWSAIQADRKSGALVLVMGAGDIDEWARSRIADAT